ncbi:hypothetical protein B0H14DRAFT_1362487 [Mycena olivaceomarginata]|nr:hypothetical protein B0H14DRAFT_1362487 [Mycena olivaceomarginata]
MLPGFQKPRGGRPAQKPSSAAFDIYQPSQCPDKHTDRMAWNEHFEQVLWLKYGNFSFDLPLLEGLGPDHCMFKGKDITEHIVELSQLTKELMRLEGWLAALAVDNLTYGSFEAEWKELPVRKKEDLALEGLYRGACSCPPGEYNLIHLLKRIVEHDPTGDRRVKEVFLFKHPYVEHEHRFTDAASDLIKAYLHDSLLLRNVHIVGTLIGVIGAYRGVPRGPSIYVMTSQPIRHGEKAKAR